jgi:hypothetical protein
MPSDDHRDVMYIFASKNRSPDNPAWYHNLVDAGTADVEVGTDNFPVSVSKVTEPERGREYSSGRVAIPPLANTPRRRRAYAKIPVLALRRV